MYVLNGPLSFTDPLGLYEWASSAGGAATDEELLARSGDKTLKKAERKLAERQYNFRQQFKANLQAAKDALTNSSLEPAQRAEVERAVNSYGDWKKEDNVSVGMVASENDSSVAGFGERDGKIHIDLNLDLSDRNPAVTIAHEGSHVADYQELANARGTSNEPSKDISLYATEQRAYFVSSYAAQALQISPYYPGAQRDEQVWNKGWKANEREVKRANGVTKKNYWNKDSNPGTNLSNPINLNKRY